MSMYVWSAHSGEYRWTRYYGCKSCSRSDNRGKCCFLCPRSLISTRRLNLVLSHGNPAAFHEGFHIYTANRYGVSPKLLPRVQWHSACNILSPTMRYVKRKQNTKPRFERSTDSIMQVREQWSTVHSMHWRGWLMSRAERAEPKAATNDRRAELQVRKLRCTVHSMHWRGWSTSTKEIAEQKAAASYRLSALQVRVQWSTVHNMHWRG